MSSMTNIGTILAEGGPAGSSVSARIAACLRRFLRIR
jgi:hypothetical protein